MLKPHFLFFFLLSLFFFSNALSQDTYKIGTTEYYYNRTYSTTGKPMVKRSEANKMKFLKSLGYTKIPRGYEIDHIIPLSQGGSDDPSNMQLLTVEAHDRKTARERACSWCSSSTSYPLFGTSSSTYNSGSTRSKSKTTRVIYTGPKGGKYYYNSKGKKVYVGR